MVSSGAVHAGDGATAKVAAESPRPADAVALARCRRRIAAAPEAPWLHQEVARRMASRLALIKQPPKEILDWWAPLGGSGDALREAVPAARVQALWPEGVAPPAAPTGLRRWWPRRGAAAAVDLASIAPRSVDLLWSNMGLHTSADPPALFARWRGLIRIDGFLMFSTLGPGTLVELTALYRRAGWGPALAPLVDMHDLGDMLVQAGFADPVMDQETLTLTWADAPSLLAELRLLGVNADPARHAGLRTPRWRERLLQALEARRGADGRIALSIELVYGHAFCPPPKAMLQGQTNIALDDLRAMARAPRRR